MQTMRVFAVAMLAAALPLAWGACTPAALSSASLSEGEQARAEERGHRFAQVRLTESARPYKLEHLTEGHPPRIHPRMDASLLVLSGSVRIQVDGHEHELSAGDSIDIPHGAWYSTQTLDEDGSSVFFAFERPLQPHSPTAETHSVETDHQALVEEMVEQ